MKKELRDVLDAATARVRSRPDYLLSPDVRDELEKLAEERRKQKDEEDISPVVYTSLGVMVCPACRAVSEEYDTFEHAADCAWLNR